MSNAEIAVGGMIASFYMEYKDSNTFDTWKRASAKKDNRRQQILENDSRIEFFYVEHFMS